MKREDLPGLFVSAALLAIGAYCGFLATWLLVSALMLWMEL